MSDRHRLMPRKDRALWVTVYHMLGYLGPQPDETSFSEGTKKNKKHYRSEIRWQKNWPQEALMTQVVKFQSGLLFSPISVKFRHSLPYRNQNIPTCRLIT